ncbi:beta-lactamase-like protein [Cladochytrium replicatum]|nr:beta-lactamase-like protein [Cladochytrium replicatum]
MAARSSVHFTPLAGARDEDSPLCYLLEIDEAKILLDCGWTDKFDADAILALKRIAKQVDAVLLSHADLEHIGALPYAVAHLGLQCPVYATIPVCDMGRLCLTDAWLAASASREGMSDIFTITDINEAFARIVQLRYSQPFALSGKANRITITAYNAGHSVGGAIWKIKKESDDIVYAVDYNHNKERHLNATVLRTQSEPSLSRPSLLITDAFNALSNPQPRKQRDAALFDVIIRALNNNGNVLIPVSTSTRVLELVYLLDAKWKQLGSTASQYPLVLLTNRAYRTITSAKSMLEWMGTDVNMEFSATRTHPFDFRHVKAIHKLADLDSMGDGPKVVLASFPSLDSGFGKELLFRWADQPNSIVLITDRFNPGSTMGTRLFEEWRAAGTDKESSAVGAPVELNFEMDFTVNSRVPLEGEELEEHIAVERQKHEQEIANSGSTRRRRRRQSALLSNDLKGGLDLDSSGSESEDDSIVPDLAAPSRTSIGSLGVTPSANMSVGATTGWVGFDAYVKDGGGLKGGASSGFFKQSQSFMMFPISDTRRKVDEYGESINVEHFLRHSEGGEGRRPTVQGENGNADDMQVDNNLAANINEEGTLEALLSIPSKFVEEQHSVKFRCQVMYIDFEGRADARSIRNIIPQVAPRKLVLIHGSAESTDTLAKHFAEAENITNEIFVPSVGESINVSAATNAYHVKLTDSLFSSLSLVQFMDHELAYVSGIIRTSDPESKADSSSDSASRQNVIPVLDMLPPERRPAHHPLLVGDLQLSEFRKVLTEHGIPSRFESKALVVNDTVVVRKAAPAPGGSGNQAGQGTVQEFVLEGPISADYFKVRELLYSQHAVL